MQSGFPVVPEPFSDIAKSIGCSESEVIHRIFRLKKRGVIRYIGTIFNSSMMGYHSTLAAFRVENNQIEQIANRLNVLPGITHNYLRENSYNIWFTLTAPKSVDLKEKITELASDSGVSDWLSLPAVRTFHIGLNLHMGYSLKTENSTINYDKISGGTVVSINKNFVRAIQGDVPLTEHPFNPAAVALGWSQEALITEINKYIKAGIIRRFAAVLNPVKAGYVKNVLVAWSVSSEHIEKAGFFAASLSEVSHCYQRLDCTNWPFHIYTMIHGCSIGQCRNAIRKIAENQPIMDYCELPTLRELKKSRTQYFL